MRLYDRLLQRKQHGEKLDMRQISYEDLFHLWWREDCSDAEIAELYDVSKKKVTNLRQTWGIKLIDIIVREFEEKFNGVIPTASDEVENGSGSLRTSGERDTPTVVALLLRKIEGLNDLEFEDLRLELARRFPVFETFTNDADFLSAVERAVRQFKSTKGD